MLREIRVHLMVMAVILSGAPMLTVTAQVAVPDALKPGAVRPEETGRPTLPPQPAEEVFKAPDSILDVPAVIDRPFDVDAGPRVEVNRFHLADAQDLPRYGIRVADIERILQEQISARPDGFTIGHLEQAAAAVTVYYRNQGLVLAQAVIPVQTVEDGIVEMQIFIGTLGRVLVEGNTIYRDKILLGPFRRLIGEPVTKDSIESALLQLTDFPGLTVFGIFQPGQLVGTADIILTVQNENRFDFAYRVDNHGLQETGRGRFRPTFEWNNITGAADRLSLAVQQTYRPKNNTFYSVDYQRYLGRGVKAGAGWNRNTFAVGGELALQQITGESNQISGYLDKALIRSRQMNLSARVGLTHKDSSTRTRDRQTNKDKLTIVSLSSSFDNVDIRFRGINFATFEYSRGINDLFGAMGSSLSAAELELGQRPSRRGGPADDRFAAGQFDKIFLTASRLQTLSPEYGLTLLVRGEYQWSNNLLVPLEQYSVGGPDNVRSYPPAQKLLDRAVFGSIELIKSMPFIGDREAFRGRSWGEVVQLSVFYDVAVGRLNKPLGNEIQEGFGGNVNFQGAGIQLRFTLPGFIESRIIYASELGRQKPANGRPNQLWGELIYRF